MAVRRNDENWQRIKRVLSDEDRFIETLFFIRTKSQGAQPFKLNAIQQEIRRTATKRNIYLKPRQVGLSTYLVAKRLARCLTRRNWLAVSAANDTDTTELLFQIVHFIYRNLPLPSGFVQCTQYESREELYFPETDARYIIFTAGKGSGLGRGATINDLHCSELAFWRNPYEALGALMETVPKDAYIDKESTPNGAGGSFYNDYNDAREKRTGFKSFFFGWWQEPAYRLSFEEAATLNVNTQKIYQPKENAEDTASEEDLARAHSLTWEQIYWRRWKRRESGLFTQEYPENDIDCFLLSGSSYFVKQLLIRAQKVGVTEPIEQTETRKTWARPVEGRKYIIGADTAEGVEGGDYCAAYVLDTVTGEQVAAIHGTIEPTDYAHRLAEIGYEYNQAIIAVERNNHGHAVLAQLIHGLDYPNVYHQEGYDEDGEIKKKPGFLTNSKTRPIALTALAEQLRDSPTAFKDKAATEEMLTFVKTAGKPQAQKGCYDDRVMALAIAAYILQAYYGKTQPAVVSKPVGGGDKSMADELLDLL